MIPPPVHFTLAKSQHLCSGLTHEPTQDDAEPLETSFELNDTLFAKANIEKVDEVYLWLGVRSKTPSHPIKKVHVAIPPQYSAKHPTTSHSHPQNILTQVRQANVMLSYPIPEAEELLTNKLSAAQQSLRNCEEDRKSTRLNSSHSGESRMPSSA